MNVKRAIWVIDDHEELNEIVEEILSDAGYSVRTFCNARPALEAIVAGARPDLVLLDWRLPGMTGDDFLSRLDEHGIDLAVVLFSAVVKQIAFGVRRRVTGTLSKPCSLTELLETVERALTRSAAPAERERRLALCGARAQPERAPADFVRRGARLRLVV
jgi:DNA-binding NtrC family response regulator